MEETSLAIYSFQKVKEIDLVGGKKHILYLVEVEEGIAQLGGPELMDQSETNLYMIEWVDIEKISNLPSVYPSEAVEITLSLV